MVNCFSYNTFLNLKMNLKVDKLLNFYNFKLPNLNFDFRMIFRQSSKLKIDIENQLGNFNINKKTVCLHGWTHKKITCF